MTTTATIYAAEMVAADGRLLPAGHGFDEQEVMERAQEHLRTQRGHGFVELLTVRTRPVVCTLEYAEAIVAKLDAWVPAACGFETPTVYRDGGTYLYVFNPATGEHAYLDTGSDVIRATPPELG